MNIMCVCVCVCARHNVSQCGKRGLGISRFMCVDTGRYDIYLLRIHWFALSSGGETLLLYIYMFTKY